ncbi:MAG TPA: hypothetical protein VM889_11900 [Candidatus Thermoplasmatota archaeon]|nr:hypothetical protein [Candidatus Thermoplasmatota archaeon]
MERSLGPFILALLLALPVAAAEGNRFHEDPAAAEEDYRVLAALASRISLETARGVEAAFAQDDEEADERLADADRRARALADGAQVEARSATSAARLAPFAQATLSVATNATTLARDWARFSAIGSDDLASPARYAEALFLLASARGALADATHGVDALDRLEVDVTRLRGALATAEAAIAEATARLEREAAHAVSGILLEATPARLALGETLTLRGLLARTDGDVGGVVVLLEADGRPWGEATTDKHGFFQLARAVPMDLAVGRHEAVARAAGLVSAPAVFEVGRIPTTLTLAPARGTFQPGTDPSFSVGLFDAHGRGVDARVALSRGGVDVGAIEVVGGRGAFVWAGAGLALGDHVLEARFEGTRTHAPSRAEASFGVGTSRSDGASRPGGLDLSVALRALLVVALVLPHAWALDRSRAPRGLLYVGPIAAGLFATALADLPTGAVAAALAAAASAIHARGRRARAIAPEPPVRETPATRAAAPVANEEPATAREAVAAAYLRILRDLEASGLETGPRTPREIERILLDRGHPAGPVREVTRLAERALYEGRAADEDVPAFMTAARSIGGSAG